MRNILRFNLIFVVLLCACASPKRSNRGGDVWQEGGAFEADQTLSDAEYDRNEKRAAYLAEHSDLKPEVRDAIAHRKILLGMTQDEVCASLQNVDNFHSVTTPQGLKVECTYRDLHLLFVDGCLQSITR